MRTVLLVAPHFPPLGGAAVQRNTQLARRLAEVGYRPIVVTRAGARDDFRWTPRDTALVDRQLPARVERLGADEPSLQTPRLRRWLRLVPKWERWWKNAAVEVAMRAGREADIIHASVAPYLVGDAALAIAQKLRKPLVLDLEDPWALDDMLTYPTGLHRRLESRLMRRVLSGGDAVVMNTQEARLRVIEAFGELDPGRVFAIPNAFDPLDFVDPEPEPLRDGRFRIVHTGSLHTDLGLRQRHAGIRRLLGGLVPDVDYLPRSHVYLLEAVRSALEARPELDGVVEVHLAGMFTDDDRRMAAGYSFVRLHEFLPHGETIALIRSADLLFLPLYDLPPGRRSGIIPHKTYEYIASGRPILAAVPDGDARDLLERSGAAALCRPSDVGCMTRWLLADVERWASAATTRTPRPDLVAWCSANRLVADLASVYETVLGGASAESSTSPQEQAGGTGVPSRTSRGRLRNRSVGA